MNKYSRGYIALVSTLILSAALTALVFSTSTHLFQTRLRELAYEYKLQSYTLAYSCVYAALQATGTDPEYTPYHEPVWLTPTDNCVIDSRTDAPATISFTTRASVHEVQIILEVTAIRNSEGSLSITAVRETTSIPP